MLIQVSHNQNVEEPHRAKRRSCTFSPDVHPPLKAAICSSGSSDNYQQLNVAPTLISNQTTPNIH
jgi:hypothetical protein